MSHAASYPSCRIFILILVLLLPDYTIVYVYIYILYVRIVRYSISNEIVRPGWPWLTQARGFLVVFTFEKNTLAAQASVKSFTE